MVPNHPHCTGIGSFFSHIYCVSLKIDESGNLRAFNLREEDAPLPGVELLYTTTTERSSLFIIEPNPFDLRPVPSVQT